MILLQPTETATPDDRILGKEWAGYYQLLCTVYTSHRVRLQARGENGVWLDASVNGVLIELKRAGDVADVRLVRNTDYRLWTETAGAEVEINKHNLYD